MQPDESDGLDRFLDGVERVPDVARFLRMGVSHVYNLMDRGELEYIKLGKCRRVPRRAMLELLERHLVKP